MLDLDECHAHISLLCKQHQPARTRPRAIHTDDEHEFEGHGRVDVSEPWIRHQMIRGTCEFGIVFPVDRARL